MHYHFGFKSFVIYLKIMKMTRRKFIGTAAAASVGTLIAADNYGTQFLSECGCYPKNGLESYLTSLRNRLFTFGNKPNRPAYAKIPDSHALDLNTKRFPSKTGMPKFADCYLWFDSVKGPNGETFGTRHWDEGYVAQPRCGEYSSCDPKMIAKQINDFYIYNFVPRISYWGETDPYSTEVLVKHFLKSPCLNENPIQFTVLFESEQFGNEPLDPLDCGIDLKFNEERFNREFDYLNENVLGHPNYLKIGAPLVFLYDAHRYKNAVDVIRGLRKRTEDRFGRELLLIALVDFWRDSDVKLIKEFDGIGAYNLYSETVISSELPPNFKQEALARSKKYASLAKLTRSGFFVQPILQTFVKNEHAKLIMTDEEFDNCLGISKEIAMHAGGEHPMMSGVYNEWHEGPLEESVHGKRDLESFGST